MADSRGEEDVGMKVELLRGIASSLRAEEARWSVARVAELLGLYERYLRGFAANATPVPVEPLPFALFVADETLHASLPERRTGP